MMAGDLRAYSVLIFVECQGISPPPRPPGGITVVDATDTLVPEYRTLAGKNFSALHCTRNFLYFFTSRSPIAGHMAVQYNPWSAYGQLIMLHSDH